MKFYINKLLWEFIYFISERSRQLGLVRNTGICITPSCGEGKTNEPSNWIFQISSINKNIIKTMKKTPIKKYLNNYYIQ